MSILSTNKDGPLVPTRQTATPEDLVRIVIKEVAILHGVPHAIVSDRDTFYGGTAEGCV